MNVSAVGTLILELNSAIFHAVKLFETRQRMTMSQATTTTPHKKKSEKSTPSKYTFDHLALGVHNIFISYFFPLFFSFPLSIHFLVVRCDVLETVGRRMKMVLIEYHTEQAHEC